jgi:TonB family protein
MVVSMAVNSSTLKKRIKIMMNNQPNKSYKKSIFLMAFSALFMIGIISCSDLQQNGLTNQEVKMVQHDIAMQKSAENQPLYVINGEPYHSPETISRIKTKYIESINVLKGEAAVSKYGEAGANGVVEITLNAKEKALNDLMKNPPPPPTPGEGEAIISFQSGQPSAPFFVAVEEMPELIGGLESITSKINYPEKASNAGIEGKVIIQFIVNEQGKVENPQIIKGVAESLDQEALRVVKQAKFVPGKQRGEPVRVQYAMPITFTLSDKK